MNATLILMFVWTACFSLPAMAEQAALTDEERRTLERYEAQEQAYQPVAMKQINAQVGELQRDIRAIRRNKEMAEPARDNAIAHINKQIEQLKEMLEQMRTGELVLPPQLDCDRVRTGNFGTLNTAKSEFKGYGYTTSYSAASGFRYAYEPDHRGRGHIVYLQTIDADGKPTQSTHNVIFEVVERLDPYQDKPAYRIRAIDITALRTKRGPQQADDSSR